MGVGGLQVHEICNYRLVYREVVEARPDYKPYLPIALRHGCSVNLLHIFRTPFYKNIYGGLLLFLRIKYFSVHSTVEFIYSGHAIQRTPCYNRHFLVEPAESQSNSHRKPPIQRTLVMADTIFWNRMNISFENCLSIDTCYSGHNFLEPREHFL